MTICSLALFTFWGCSSERAGTAKTASESVSERQSDSTKNDEGLVAVQRWLDDNPQARPLKLVALEGHNFNSGDIHGSLLPPNSCKAGHFDDLLRGGPQPGWYAVPAAVVAGERKILASAQHLTGAEFSYFQFFDPVEVTGGYKVYHLTLDAVDEVRPGMGFPQVSTSSEDAAAPKELARLASVLHVFLKLHHKRVATVDIAESLAGPSVLEVRDCLRAFGLNVDAVKSSPQDVRYPAIAWYTQDEVGPEDLWRVALILERQEDLLVIDLVNTGMRAVAKREFEEQTTGYYLQARDK